MHVLRLDGRPHCATRSWALIPGTKKAQRAPWPPTQTSPRSSPRSPARCRARTASVALPEHSDRFDSWSAERGTPAKAEMERQVAALAVPDGPRDHIDFIGPRGLGDQPYAARRLAGGATTNGLLGEPTLEDSDAPMGPPQATTWRDRADDDCNIRGPAASAESVERPGPDQRRPSHGRGWTTPYSLDATAERREQMHVQRIGPQVLRRRRNPSARSLAPAGSQISRPSITSQ